MEQERMSFRAALREFWERISGKKALRVGGYSVIASLIVLGIAVALNVLVNALPASWTQYDTSSAQLFTISEQTEGVLADLEEDVTIYWVVQAGQEDETLGTLLDRYAALSSHITVEVRDPDVYPAFMEQYITGTIYNNSLVVESAERYTYVGYDSIYSYSYDGESVELENEDGEWKYALDSAFPLDTDYVDSMLAALSGLTATSEIEAPDDKAQYGLDEPVLTVTLTLEGETTLTFGDETAMGGERYVSTGDGNVYIVDAAAIDPFSYGLYDLIECEAVPNMTDTLSLTVESETQSYTLESITEDAPYYTDYYEWYLVTDEGYTALGGVGARGVVSSVTGVSWNECVCYDASDEDLESYGLDTPAAVATVQYIYTETDDDGEETEYEASFTLELGDYCDGGVYARIAGSDMVYIVDATILDNLLDITPEIDMLPTEPVRLTLSDVTGFDVTIDGETYSVSISRGTVYDDEGNESEEVTYTLSDGTELDSDTVTGLLEDLNSMSGDGTGAGRGGEELVSFTFYQEREGYETVTLSFDEYNSTDCITTLNGETGILAPLDTVNSVIEGLLEAFTAEDGESSEETAE